MPRPLHEPSVVVTDVADWSQVTRLIEEAVHRFGRIDTSVNTILREGYRR